jgi:hypothetical protein
MRLVELYRIIEPGTTALVADASGVDVDERHPLVRRHRCEAQAELAHILQRAGQSAAVRTARNWWTANCATPPSLDK